MGRPTGGPPSVGPRHRDEVEADEILPGDWQRDHDSLPGAIGDWRQDAAYAFVVLAALYALGMLGLALIVLAG